MARDGSRKAIRLGKCSRRDAESFKIKVETLHSANMLGNSPDRETSAWLASLGDDIHQRLFTVGLTEPRETRNPSAVTMLGEFADQFIAGNSDKAEGTLSHYRQAKGLVVAFLGADKPLASVTPHDADQFRSWMKGHKKTKGGKAMAENTVRGHLKNAKLIFGSALKARLIVENPFRGISSQLVKRPERMAFVDDATINKVIDACPSSRWRAIVVLCRYAGLRCPSEVFALLWTDVDFDGGRMKVRSPKGENFGKGIREVPLFPEVRSALSELYLEPDGGEHVIGTNDRSSAKNLRTTFEKILKRAGVDAWPRLMQNLRSSRETELAQQFPIQTVTAWLGNTPKVALETISKSATKISPRPSANRTKTALHRRCGTRPFPFVPVRTASQAKMKTPLFRRDFLQNKGFPNYDKCPH